MATTTNFNWETPDDTDLVKDGAAAIRTALNGVDTSFVDLKGGTTGQVLSKASNTDLDFTWATDASGIPATIFDAKGDIIAATAADTASRLAVGTNGQVLTADSTTATGLKWANAGGGGKVLQVVQGTTTTSTTIASTTFADTNLSATITPSSTSSKILIFINQQTYQSRLNVSTAMGLKILRGSTDVYVLAPNKYETFSLAVSPSINNLAGRNYVTGIYLDSPSSTSALTYKTQGVVPDTSSSGAVTFQENSSTSTITLMEIGA